jgi:hypothetical protein
MNKCIKPLDPFPTDLPLSPSLALLLRKLEWHFTPWMYIFKD